MLSRIAVPMLAAFVVFTQTSCGESDSARGSSVGGDASTEASDAPDDGSTPEDAGADADASVLPDALAEADAPLEADAPADGDSPEGSPDGATDAGLTLSMTFQHGTDYGVAAWNADGTGLEPALVGYSIPQPYAACMPNGEAVAFAYVSSADHDGILANCPGAVQGNPSVPAVGFDAFVAQFTVAGKPMESLAIRFAPLSLESPAAFPGNPEHRVYKVGAFAFHFDGEPMVVATGDTVEMVVDYKDGADCNDDVVEATTSELTVSDDSSTSSAAVKALAAAFLADVAGRKIKLRFQGFQALAPLSGTLAGRTGAVFTIGGGAQLDLAP